MFVAEIGETDLRERSLFLVQAVYGADRSFRDRQQRTANTVHRQFELPFYRPQCDSGTDQVPAVNRPYELSMYSRTNSISIKHIKK